MKTLDYIGHLAFVAGGVVMTICACVYLFKGELDHGIACLTLALVTLLVVRGDRERLERELAEDLDKYPMPLRKGSN